MNIPIVRVVDRYVGIPLCRLLAWSLGRGRPSHRQASPKRILVIRNFGLGNLLLMLPTLRALRERYPDARIHALTLDLNRGFLERTGYCHEIRYLRASGILAFCWSVARNFGPLLANRYDVLIDFEQFARTSAILGLLLRIPRRIGFATDGQGRESAYTDPVPYRNDVHMMDGFYGLLAPLGIQPISGLMPEPIATTPEEDRRVDDILRTLGIEPAQQIAVLHPGTSANFVLRRWPVASYAAVGDFLSGEGFRVVLTGMPSEAEIVTQLADQMTTPAVSTVGRLSLGEFLALLRRATLVISNDTGPLHLAAAQGATAIGLYGPNTPVLYGPRGPHALAFTLNLPCSPCITNFNEKGSACKDNLCMRLMGADQVIASLKALFDGVTYMPTAAGTAREMPNPPAVHPLLLRRRAKAPRPVSLVR